MWQFTQAHTASEGCARVETKTLSSRLVLNHYATHRGGRAVRWAAGPRSRQRGVVPGGQQGARGEAVRQARASRMEEGSGMVWRATESPRRAG